eukprot:jgi/Ulvmu1/684/UM010_0056.1
MAESDLSTTEDTCARWGRRPPDTTAGAGQPQCPTGTKPSAKRWYTIAQCIAVFCIFLLWLCLRRTEGPAGNATYEHRGGHTSRSQPRLLADEALLDDGNSVSPLAACSPGFHVKWWDLSRHDWWDGDQFPEAVVTYPADVETAHQTLSFIRQQTAGNIQGPWGVVNFTGAWAAQATGYVCSSASSWQYLQLHAMPGTQLIIDGRLAVATAADGAVEAYPRGPAVDALALRWAPPGCAQLQLRMFEPPRCGPGHIEELSAPPPPSPPLTEVTVAYSNSSVMLCGGLGCPQSQRVTLPRGAGDIVVRMEWAGGTLTQSLSYTDSEDHETSPEGWVLSNEGSVPANADVLRLEHVPAAYDQSAQAPAIVNVTVQNHAFHFVNRGWDAAALALGVGGAGRAHRALRIEVWLDLGVLDDTASVIKVLLEDQPAAHMVACYSGEPIEVELRERRIWASDGNTTRAVAPLAARNTGPMRVYGRAGCGEVACRSAGWTVQHSAVVITADVDGGLERLRRDAAAVRSYVRSMHGADLMRGEFAVNVQVSWLGENHGYQMEMQDVMNRMLCDSSAKHAIGWGISISLRPTAAAATAAQLLAAQLHAAFRGAIPALNIHSMCYGALRIPTHAAHASPMWRPAVMPPDVACLHGSPSANPAGCLPLWSVALHRGSCPTAVAPPHISDTRVPTPFDRDEAEVDFMAESLDFFRSSCMNTYPGFPAGWRVGYCARADSVYCVATGVEVVRFVLVAGSLPRTAATLLVDGSIVAAVAAAGDGAYAAAAVDLAGTRREVMADAVLVMHAGCHHMSVAFEDDDGGSSELDGPSSIRLHAQQLRRLPGIGSAALPLSAGMQHVLSYPRPSATPFKAGSANILFSGSGCARVPCGPAVVAAALTIVDAAADARTALLPNMALSAWLSGMFEPAGGSGNTTGWEHALRGLQEAAGDSADLALGDPETWIKVVAAPSASGTVQGRWNKAGCSGESHGAAECECSVHVPALFPHDLYSVPQVPVVMLEVPLTVEAIPDAQQRILEAFKSLFTDEHMGQRLCMAEAASIPAPADGCTADVPPLVTSPQPAPMPCENKWVLDIYQQRCTVANDSGVVAPTRPQDEVVQLTIRTDAVDVYRTSCSQPFSGFPEALFDDLLDGIAEASGPAVLNSRDQWLTVVALPISTSSAAGHRSRPECASTPVGSACQCTEARPSTREQLQGQTLLVPAVVLDLELADGQEEAAARAVAALEMGLTRLHELGADACIQDAVGAVVGHNCGASGPQPPAVPPPPEDCTDVWTVSLYPGACPSAEASSASRRNLSRPQEEAAAVFTSTAIDFSKAACDDIFQDFPAGWSHGYCGAATVHVCVPVARVMRLLLRATGGSATLSVNGNAAVEIAATGEPEAGSVANLGATRAGDAVVGLVSGCHVVELLFEDSTNIGLDDAQVSFPLHHHTVRMSADPM